MARRKSLPRDPIVVAIDSTSESGLGLGRQVGDDGGGSLDVVAVKGALPGERVRAQVRSRRRRRLVARLVSVEESSPRRIAPRCPVFFECGGCAWQHVDGEAQLARKQDALCAALGEHGIEALHVDAPIRGPQWGYRHKARLGVRWVPAAGGALVGFREFDSSKVTRMDDCPVLAPGLGRLIAPLKTLVGSLSEPRHIPQIEVAAGDDCAAVIVRHLQPLGDSDLAALSRFGTDFGVQVLRQGGGPDSIVHVDGRRGDASLGYRVGDIELRFHPAEFTQVNPHVNRLLVDEVLTALEPGGEERILDLFCGVGNFTLPLARRARSVVGIEGAAGLVERACDNARANGITNVRFEVLNLYDPQAYPADDHWLACDAMVVDPPRSGLSLLAEHLARRGPGRIAYVSCNPDSLVRDLLVLVRGGYQVERLRLLDMFPHTAHVETLAVLRRPWSS